MTHVVPRIVAAALALILSASGAPSAWAGPHGPPGDRLEKHLEALDLAPGQMERVQAIVAESKAARDAIHARIREAYREMHALLEQEKPDEDAVMGQAEKIGAIKTEGRKAMLRTLLRVRTELTPEQRRKLMEMKHQGHGRWHRDHDAGGPPGD
jgi:Spy/CpxP family protein refolding chaperone